jgi:hypothetical protein
LGLVMSEKKSVYRETAKRFQKAKKKEKKQILDEFVKLTGLNRDYSATLLRLHGKTVRLGRKDYARADIAQKGKRPGRKKRYDGEVLKLLKFVWKIQNYICGKRLKKVLNDTLDNLAEHGHLPGKQEIIGKLRFISASSIDRLLKPERKKLELKGRKGTKPGTLLKQQVAVRTWADWDENIPGYLEIDLVGHEGGNNRGDYAQTLDMVDVYSGWTEQVAIKNKAAIWVKEAVEKVKKRLPFELLGLDSDTGAEFINYAMFDWCEEKEVKFTRGRSSRSNDNCFVEQKNYSVVRQNVGYLRYDTDEEVYWLNRLYGHLRLYTNLFQPVMKMTERIRIGSKVIKKHNDIKTPCERLLDHPLVDDDQKRRLKELYWGLDLFRLKKEITRCQKKLWKIQKDKKGTGYKNV